MKYMFASDVHGSAYYCRKKMLDVYKEEKGRTPGTAGRSALSWPEKMIFPENMLPNRSFPCLMT